MLSIIASCAPPGRTRAPNYALNYTSLDFPNLRRSTYKVETVNHILEPAAKDYVNHHRGVSIQGDDFMVSSLYIWFHADFGDFDAAIPQRLRRYAGPTLKSALDG